MEEHYGPRKELAQSSSNLRARIPFKEEGCSGGCRGYDGVEWEINCKWMECLTYFLVIPFFITMWRCINIQSISRMSHDAVTLFRTQKSIPNNSCVSPLTIPYPVMSPSQGFPCQSLPYSFYLWFHRPNSLCHNYLMLLL